MFAAQLRTALVIAWLAATLALLPVLLAPFLLSPETIFAVAPICEARARGESCFLCGMTTAFVLIGHLRLDDAVRANHASIPLYAALVWNQCVAMWFVTWKIAARWPRRSVRIVFRLDKEVSCKS